MYTGWLLTRRVQAHFAVSLNDGWILVQYNLKITFVSEYQIKSKSNLHYTRRITPKRVTSCGAHLRGLAPGQHSSEETLQRWRVVGNTLCRFDRPGYRTSDLPHRQCALSNWANGRLFVREYHLINLINSKMQPKTQNKILNQIWPYSKYNIQH